MSKINQYSAAEKLCILQELELGQTSVLDITRKYDISKSTLKEWRYRYKRYGYEGLEIRTYYKRYSAELKIQAVLDYLSGNYSQQEIISKYKIAGRTQLRTWIKKYNSHSRFKSNEGGGKHSMTKGRKTNWKERIDVVLYCLSHNHDYQNTAIKYQVSYQQVTGKIKQPQSDGISNQGCLGYFYFLCCLLDRVQFIHKLASFLIIYTYLKIPNGLPIGKTVLPKNLFTRLAPAP